jgi:hypothetical protein
VAFAIVGDPAEHRDLPRRIRLAVEPAGDEGPGEGAGVLVEEAAVVVMEELPAGEDGLAAVGDQGPADVQEREKGSAGVVHPVEPDRLVLAPERIGVEEGMESHRLVSPYVLQLVEGRGVGHEAVAHRHEAPGLAGGNVVEDREARVEGIAREGGIDRPGLQAALGEEENQAG